MPTDANAEEGDSLPAELGPLLNGLPDDARAQTAAFLRRLQEQGWHLRPPSGRRGPAVDRGSSDRLLAAWENRDDDETDAYPRDDYEVVARAALRSGELLLACDAALAGLRHYPGDAGLVRLAARAQAEMGRTAAARELIESLVAGGHEDSETLGLLGRCWKDEGFARRCAGLSPAEAWGQAARVYGRSFERHRLFFAGINAATMALLLGDPAEADRLARAVDALAADACGANPADHWAAATRGEAALLCRQWAQAEAFYRQAISGLPARSADIASMGRQAGRILDEWKSLGEDVSAPLAWTAGIFPRPDVVVFSGHRFDLPGRAAVRFPESSAGSVKAGLKAWFARRGTRTVYASMSAGADLLMAEAALEAGIALRLVLSAPPERAWELSGEPLHGWRERFFEVCRRADAVTVLGDGTGPAEALVFSHCNRVFTGLACLEADALGVSVRGLVVWNGKPGDAGGGTAECVADWLSAGLAVDVMDPVDGNLSEQIGSGSHREEPAPDNGVGLVVRTMLFADVKGFSKLSERELGIFTREFRGGLVTLLSKEGSRCELIDTWGDGVFMVFRAPADAARTALAFRDMVQGTDWCAMGLGQGIGLRVGLHAGPVGADPVDGLSGRPQFYGSNIARAARIEPITEVGQVYASDGFAALLRICNPEDLTLDYVGSIPLAKHYGRQRLFRLDWKRAAAGHSAGR